ncbi:MULTISPECIES: hypothetical protein [Cyanophyceae]|uniref:Uncharacterized protein n=1 Tax=Pseudocalidococcus azoricus BACA0444 TaxID=2918990 RepID=A0AAE4FPT2_9CYAN|nr:MULTISPECIES: hypothetical protein [Cyanophyceae]AFY62437.1 hypothetical protein Syn6312_3410 [Synechococcus sp. PCC 6312]MDS3859880.1 hypothetical protein [Pseudocalidococcus azoricus BACA0444]
MTHSAFRPLRLRFPLWRYLNQPLGLPGTFLNPHRFWQFYQYSHLERCWRQDCPSFGDTSEHH